MAEMIIRYFHCAERLVAPREDLRRLSLTTGAYGVLIATPERHPLRTLQRIRGRRSPAPGWPMTKAITCIVIGRLIQEGWLSSVYDPAPAPLRRDPRSIHRLITLLYLLKVGREVSDPPRQ